MRWVLSVNDVKELERDLEESGTPLSHLMEAAGKQSALVAMREFGNGPYVVLCGPGNNGGDGWVCADELAKNGHEVHIITAVIPEEIKSDLARGYALKAVEVGLPIYVNPSVEKIESLLSQATVVVDAILGTGFSGETKEPYATWIHCVDQGLDLNVLSIDVPSGLNAQTGERALDCMIADITVTMLALKPGLLSGAGKDVCGDVILADLIDCEDKVADLSLTAEMSAADFSAAIPELKSDASKYTRGHVLVVAGSAFYSGAAILCARAAERSGAGYVTLAVPDAAAPAVRAQLCTIPVMALPSDKTGAFAKEAATYLKEFATHFDVVVAGPGMGTGEGSLAVIRELLAADTALVLDADALNCVARMTDVSLADKPELLRREKPLVLTPHAGELGRLLHRPTPENFGARAEAARLLAWGVGSSNFAVLAKGDTTVSVTAELSIMPEPGPAALAKAGTGDVLAGLTGSLLAQAVRGEFLNVVYLAAAAAQAHGMAAERAIEKVGSHGLIATDVIDHLGVALDELEDAQNLENLIVSEGFML